MLLLDTELAVSVGGAEAVTRTCSAVRTHAPSATS